MAKHKAATQITIASIQEKTTYHELVDRYWKAGVVLALAITAAILIPAYRNERAEKSHHEIWDELRGQADLGSGMFGQVRGGAPTALSGFADQHRGEDIGAWAKALEIGAEVQSDKLDEAAKASADLRANWPDHLLNHPVIPKGDTAVALPEAIQAGKERLQAWEKEHAFLFSNPDLTADAPRVKIHTNKGDIVVGLYVDRAPKHAANFLELCKQGFYNGTKFHRVVRGSLIQGGDPNSISGDPETWGQGGPQATIEPEIDPQLRHFRGTLSAWKTPGEVNSHGSQFVITTADQAQVNDQNVIFGRVLEGLSVIDTIESGAVVGDRPQDPAVIESTEVL